ncbi:MAG TPA: hypothetical protein VMH28_03670 [Candidatus Acidoferrales bacterium]|nr:hypothetical protein [Candidatus Acidoferrales bacterium]
MNYRALEFACYCGEAPDRILEVGVTSDRHLVVHFWCSSCNRVLFVSRTLAECKDMCPEPDPGSRASEDKAQDVRFLQSIGIAADTEIE